MIEIKLEKFAGPLNLLLKMIEKEKMDITEISLANIANQYIEYIQKENQIKPAEIADFLIIATKLLFIKTKALLPYLYQQEDDFFEENLEEQLKIYKEYLEASKVIEKMIAKNRAMFARDFNLRIIIDQQKNKFSPPVKRINQNDLEIIFKNVLLKNKPVKNLEKKLISEKINLEDKIFSIQDMIRKKVKFSFNKILSKSKNRTEIIVNFLAILELARQKEVVLVQGDLFSDICIVNKPFKK